MNDNPPIQYNQKYGRTWVDFWSSTGGLMILVILFIILIYFGWDYIQYIPKWVYPALILGPIIYTPFLSQRAKDGSKLFLIAHGPQTISEFRVGKNVDLDIEGQGINLISKSGVNRILLTEFDPNSRKGKGSALAEFTQFEMARDLSTLDRLSTAFSEHLRSERITQEIIAVEVEKRVKDLSERWVKIAMSTLEPEELENALSLATFEEELNTSIEDVLDFEL
jgi:hypothetical protein